MEKSDIEKAAKEMPEEQREAFVKGALWFHDRMMTDKDILMDEDLPLGSIVLERRYGVPMVVLGPSLGEMSQGDARGEIEGIWRLPSADELKSLYKDHEDVFHTLDKMGERCLMTSDTACNNYGGTWYNPIVFHTSNGTSSQIIPCYKPYPVRAIIKLR